MATIPTFPATDVQPLRDALGMTQEEFAKALGVSQELVSNWERDRRTPRGPAAILLSQLEARARVEKSSASS